MLITIVLFIFILGILIFVHELGHFIMAKRTGMGVNEFGFGFPPRIFGIQRITKNIDNKPIKSWRIVRGAKTPEDTPESKGNTTYSINWLPLGGFVKIKGEQGDKVHEEDSFAHKKIWQRSIVISAGVLMNFILAFVLISIGFSIGLPSIVDENPPANAIVSNPSIQVVQVQEDSPAANADIITGDFITSINDQTYTTTVEFQEYTKTMVDQELTITIKRGSDYIEKTLTPVVLDEDDIGKIGVWLADVAIVRYPWYYSLWIGAQTTVSVTWQILVAFYNIIKDLITGQPVSVDIAGPVGIAAMTGQVARLGFVYILQFAAILSINLGIINFVPFPALDGGRFLFLMIEKIRGKKANQKIESIIHNVGFFILIAIVLIVTFKDVSRFSENIKGFFSNIF